MSKIAAIVREYLAAFPEEHNRLSRFSDLIESASTDQELVSRKNFVGHVTASGFIISRSGSKILLLHHKFLGKFLQPGGHLEPDEHSPLDGALREIEEETSLTSLDYFPFHLNREVPMDIDTHQIPENKNKGEPGHWHHDLRYLFICNDEAPELILDENESVEYRWFDLDELQKMPSFLAVTGKIQKALRQGIKEEIESGLDR